MKFSDNANVEIIFGNGTFDARIIREVLEKNKDKYCEISIFLPKRGKEGKGGTVGSGIKGVFRFIKTALKFPPSTYIAFVDKEHYVPISDAAKQYGIRVSVKEIDKDVYRVCGNIGDKNFLVYFILLGFYCCIEDLVLGACGKFIEKHTGEGCCVKYKQQFKKLTEEEKNKCIESSYNILFQKISVVVEDIEKKT